LAATLAAASVPWLLTVRYIWHRKQLDREKAGSRPS
jgi:hypothetical protein